MKNNIYKILAICCVVFNTSLFSNNLRDSIYINPQWNTIYPSRLSPDGEWVVIYQTYGGKQSFDKAYCINTRTKQKTDVSDLSNFINHMLFNNVVVSKRKNVLTIANLVNPAQNFNLDNIKQFETKAIKDNNIIITLTNKGELNVIKLNKHGKSDKIVLSRSNVEKFYVNPSKTRVVFMTTSPDKELHSFDFESLETSRHLRLNKEIDFFKWSYSEDIFAVKDTENRITLINTNANEIKEIVLEQKKLERFKLDFYSNNDIFIHYNTKSEEKIPESEYLDIWNGNSRFIIPNNFNSKFKINYKAFVFKYDSSDLTELERSRDNDYAFINIPGYLLSYNHFKFEDFSSYNTKKKYTLIQTNPVKKIREFSKVSDDNFIVPSLNRKYILYPVNEDLNTWQVYEVQTKNTYTFTSDGGFQFRPTWSSDSKFIFFKQENNLMCFSLEEKETKQLTKFKNFKKLSYINKLVNFQPHESLIDRSRPTLFTAEDEKGTTIYSLYNNKVKRLLKTNENNLSRAKSSFNKLITQDAQVFVYTEENFNLPVSVKVLRNGKETTLLNSDLPKEFYNWRKMKTINYKDDYGKDLLGDLYYPKNYDPAKQYPMVVYIYDMQKYIDKEFVIPTTLNKSGFNPVLLNELGYFVYFPQTYVSDDGPGISAVNCVTRAVEAAIDTEGSIDSKRLGLFGFSFGGYKASFIATQTDLFSAIVCGAGAHDLIGGFTFRYSLFRRMPDWFMAENSQYQLKETYARNPQKYINNSPLLNAYKIKTPMLLFTGLLDENVNWENTQKMYIALKRYNIPSIALFYKDMGHGTGADQPVESKDLTRRTVDWFNYFLKDEKNINWIQGGINYNEYSWSRLDDF